MLILYIVIAVALLYYLVRPRRAATDPEDLAIALDHASSDAVYL